MGDSFRKVPLSKGLFALVDAEDFERVAQFRWCASLESRGRKYYAIRWVKEKGRQRKIRMHRFILGLGPGDPQEGDCVDHLNSDSLDNRKCNLEIISQEENRRRQRSWKKKISEPYL
jgi:hypothetical protein